MPKPCDCGGQKAKVKCYDWCSSIRADPIELDNYDLTETDGAVLTFEHLQALVDGDDT